MGSLHANACARDIFRFGEGLLQVGDRLCASLPVEAESLRRLIYQSVRTGRGEATFAGRTLALTRPAHARPLGVLVAPLRTNRFDRDFSGRRVCAVVLVSAPEQPQRRVGEVLSMLYGLTPAESRLAQKLVEGLSLKAAAEALGISKETARNQLKAVFAKTDTHRQSQVVRLALSSPAAWLARL